MNDRPLAQTVVLPPSNINRNPFPVLATHFGNQQARVFYLDDNGHVTYFDHEYYATTQSDSDADFEFYQWFCAYAGKSVDPNDGRIINMSLPNRISELSNMDIARALSSRYPMIREDEVQQNDAPVARTSFSASTSSSTHLVKNKEISSLEISINLENTRIHEGYCYKEPNGYGKLLKVSDSDWIQMSTLQSVKYRLTEVDRENGHFLLRDAIRELEFKIPVAGGDAFFHSTYRDQSSDWSIWKKVTPIAVLD